MTVFYFEIIYLML